MAKEQKESKAKDKEIAQLKQLSEDHRRNVLVYAGKERDTEKKIQVLEAVIVGKKESIQNLRNELEQEQASHQKKESEQLKRWV